MGGDTLSLESNWSYALSRLPVDCRAADREVESRRTRDCEPGLVTDVDADEDPSSIMPQETHNTALPLTASLHFGHLRGGGGAGIAPGAGIDFAGVDEGAC